MSCVDLVRIFLFTCSDYLLYSSLFLHSPFSQCRKFGIELKVSVGNPCTFYVGSKAKELHFQEDQSSRPQIRKGTAQSVILLWPTRL